MSDDTAVHVSRPPNTSFPGSLINPCTSHCQPPSNKHTPRPALPFHLRRWPSSWPACGSRVPEPARGQGVLPVPETRLCWFRGVDIQWRMFPPKDASVSHRAEGRPRPGAGLLTPLGEEGGIKVCAMSGRLALDPRRERLPLGRAGCREGAQDSSGRLLEPELRAPCRAAASWRAGAAALRRVEEDAGSSAGQSLPLRGWLRAGTHPGRRGGAEARTASAFCPQCLPPPLGLLGVYRSVSFLFSSCDSGVGGGQRCNSNKATYNTPRVCRGSGCDGGRGAGHGV